MNHRQLQPIPIIDITPAFDAGSSDGYSDALRGHPKDAAQRFQSWHRSRPVEDFAEYEVGYNASYEQVKGAE
jgi:hypothetical protein